MILDAVEQVGGIYVVTANHGNAEDMVKRNKKGEPILKDDEVQNLTSHTLQPIYEHQLTETRLLLLEKAGQLVKKRMEADVKVSDYIKDL
ncbi:phosphoglycerate mutase, 2,3-bisphosphoglycerate-independent [Artemisia annua]|uniref:Phosphoglycerate mutase, 2,3-bisphosphoglycerate-independent n=1 Tax=Artemisia annua TaxID=35608 RepID=A0A2U1N6F6_ARTAN|nr:phosphoglycerate mutase, 2,3-bisphosphoglycerate-independent [Artemisia annua]